MNSHVARACAFLLLVILGASTLHAQGMKPLPLEYMLERDSPEGRSQRVSEMPFPAYKVIGNIYYVGEDTHASLLITTPQGHIALSTATMSGTFPGSVNRSRSWASNSATSKSCSEATRTRITWKVMRW